MAATSPEALERKRLRELAYVARVMADPEKRKAYLEKQRANGRRCAKNRTPEQRMAQKAYMQSLSKETRQRYQKTRNKHKHSKHQQINVENLTDSYICKYFLKLPKNEAPPELIELKRQIILLKRACNPDNPYHDKIPTAPE